MSEKITASNIDLVIKKNNEIKKEVSAQVLKLQTNTSFMKVSSTPQLALVILREYGLIQVPVDDEYFSGAIYAKEGKVIPVINTSLPRANQYFASWHEIYHLLFDDISLDHIIENDNVVEERKAEYFAASMLLSGVDRYYAELPPMDFISKILFCMAAFQAPYKAVLISLYEDAVRRDNKLMKKQIKDVFDVRLEDIADRFQKLGLDESLVQPSYVINTTYLQDRMRQNIEDNPELRYHADNEGFLHNIITEMRMISRNAK